LTDLPTFRTTKRKKRYTWRVVAAAMVVTLTAPPALMRTAGATGTPVTYFSDGFESGNFSAWSAPRTGGGGTATVQTARVKTGVYSARLSANSSGNSYAYVRATLGGNRTEVLASGDFYIESAGTTSANVPLLRLFDAAGTRLLSLYRQNGTTNKLWVQHSGTFNATTGSLPLGRWAHAAVRVATAGTAGTAGTVEVRLNGTLVYQTVTANLGTGGVATLQIGNDTQNQAFALYADNITATNLVPVVAPPPDVLVGAGDIAKCNSVGDEATASLLDGLPGTVFTAGDNVYGGGGLTDFTDCYGPSWGRHKDRTRPATGNHDYDTAEATGYFDYFGTAAGDPAKGYYSYDIGAWHVVVLNSNCTAVTGGCGPGSPQEQWLRADLAAANARCSVTYFHHPLFSSGEHGDNPVMAPLYQTMYDYGVDIVLAGHDHHYERFALQDAFGNATADGFRQFVVGTGGASHSPLNLPKPNSEARDDQTYGVIKLTLRSGAYDWEFIPEQGKTYTDAGTASCVDPNTAPPQTTIESGPTGTVAVTTATFGFSSSDGGSTFECRLDSGLWGVCTSPKSFAGLSSGQHTFEVRASDLAGNVDPTPASRTWTVAAGPVALFSDGFESGSFSAWSAPRTAGGGTATVQTTRVKTGLYSARMSENGNGGSYAYVRASLGVNRTSVVAAGDFYIESAGGTSANVPLLRLFDAAGTRLLSLYRQNGTSNKLWVQHSGNYYSTTGTLTLGRWVRAEVRAVTAGAAASTLEVRLDGTLIYQTSTASLGTAGAATLQIGNDTQNQAFVLYVDNITATEPSTAPPDTTPPDTTITEGPTGTDRSTEATFTFSASETGSTFECQLDAGPWSVCTSPASRTGLVDGAHTFDARAADTAGNTDPTPARATWTVDTTAPETTVTSGPTGIAGSAAATFAFSASESASFECRILGYGPLDIPPFAPCTSPTTYSGLADGLHTFEVRATDSVGNTETTSVLASWFSDTIAPDTTIESPPAASTITGDATISFSASEADATFQCRLDSDSWAACASPSHYSGLSEGAHTFQVRATDPAGNTDPTPAAASWTVDVSSPDTIIDSAPSGLVPTADATVTFSASEPGATFECRLLGYAFIDFPEWTPCTSPVSYAGLADGLHTFEVRAADVLGNTDPSLALASWISDTAAPDTTIDFAPVGTVTGDTTIAFSADEFDATFECRLDGGQWEACGSPFSVTGLGDGPHTFNVRATDPAGNADPIPGTVSWTIDSSPPDTTIDSGLSGTVTATDASFTFSAGEAGAGLECRLDGGPWEVCISPAGYSGLGDGAHTFEVRAIDGAGNVDSSPASASWAVDTMAPDTVVDAAPSGLVSSADATIAFSSVELGATFECRLDSGLWEPCTSPAFYSGLPEGDHTFEIRAVDGLGNTDASPAVASWTVDTVAPETTIDSAPTGLIASTTATIVLSANELDTSFVCRRDGGPWAPCTSPATDSDLASGAHTFEAQATDGAGNTDTTPAVASWTVDANAPETEIDSAPVGTVATSDVTVAFSADDPDASFECRLDTDSDWAACTSPANLTSLLDGPHSYEVRAVDGLGNPDATPAVAAWISDTTPPDTSIVVAPVGTVTVADTTISFTADDADPSFQCRLDEGDWEACASPVTLIGLSDGPHTFEVRAADPAGNPDPTTATASWVVDTTAPDTTIDSAPTGTVTATDAAFTFSADQVGGGFECQVDGGPWEVCTSPAEYPGLDDGAHTFDVRAIDGAGNVDPSAASASWVVDTTAPDAVIDSALSGVVAHADATILFSSVEPGVTFECRLDTGLWEACASPKSYHGLPEGDHTFEVRAMDGLGNTDATPAVATWTVDTVAPETTIDSAPTGLNTSATTAIVFSANEFDTSFVCRLDGGPWASCTSPAALSDLADGPHSFEVRASDLARNTDGTPAVASWTVDATAPETVIDSAPVGVVASADATITFSADGLGTSFECRVDNGAGWVDCTSPTNLTGLADGPHMLEVRAVDGLGNADVTPAVAAWVSDTTPPDTSIVVAPVGAITVAEATIAFIADDADPSFECRLDGGDWEPCASPVILTGLGDGPHTFDVRAADPAGNNDPMPATASWTVDATPPETTIDSGALGTVTATDASFTFSASDAGAGFECRLDAAAWALCTSPTVYSDLTDGAHTFEVRAIDTAGNTDPTPPTAHWTVDATAPETVIDSAPSGLVNLADASITFSSVELGATFECRLDNSLWDVCTSPAAYLGLAEGDHGFEVRAVDGLGLRDPAPAVASWTVDTVVPETTIDSAPTGLIASTTATLVLSANEVGASFVCRLDGGPWEACTSPAAYSGLVDGAHTVEVQATDGAGNTDPTPAGVSWKVDTTAPETVIDSGPAGVVASADGTIVFSADDPGASFECRLLGYPVVDSTPWTGCSSPASYTGLVDGPHTFEARALDGLGNADTTPAVAAWLSDTAPPDTSIVVAPVGTVTVAEATIAFTADDTDPSFECRLDGGDWEPCTSPSHHSGLDEGPHTYEIRATDVTGNVDPTPAAASWTTDTIPPDTVIDAAPVGIMAVADVTLAFSWPETGTTFQCRLDAGVWEPCTSPLNAIGLADGPHTFEARATDPAGNTDPTPPTAQWTVDTTAPGTVIDAAPAAVTASADATVTYSADEADATFECRLDVGPWEPCTSPATLTGLTEGSHTYDVRATDPAGNVEATPATAAWTVDVTAPDTTIGSAPSGAVNSADATIAFSANEVGSTFECRLDAGPWEPCSSPADLTGLDDAHHAFEVRATDGVLNTDASPAQTEWMVDTVAPDTTIDSGPSGTIALPVATFAFSANEPGSAFECRLDGGAWGACTSPVSFTGLADGAHTFEARATDPAGNADATQACRGWTIAIGPVTQFADGFETGNLTAWSQVRTGGGGTATVQTTRVRSGSYAARLSAGSSGSSYAYTRATLSPALTEVVTGGDFYVESGGATGANVPLLRLFDPAGTRLVSLYRPNGSTNQLWVQHSGTFVQTSGLLPLGAWARAEVRTITSGTGASMLQVRLNGSLAYQTTTASLGTTGIAQLQIGNDTLNQAFVLYADNLAVTRPGSPDTTPPDTTIDSGPTGTTMSTSASVAFSSNESGSIFECRLDSGAWEGCGSPKNLTGLANGPHTLEVRATDAVWNTDATPASQTWVVDTVAPQTAIDSGPAAAWNSPDATLFFSASEPAASFDCRLDSGAWDSCQSPASYTGLANAPHSFAVRATDVAGNTDGTPAIASWTVDTVAPDTVITSAPSGTVPSSTASLSFTTEPGATFQCRLDGGAWTGCTSPANYTGLADGVHSVEVRAVDGAGNPDPGPASALWMVDATAPETAITIGPSGVVDSGEATFTFSASEDGAAFQCHLDTAVWAACTSPKAYVSLGNGGHTFEVRANDAIGNTDPTPASRTWTISNTSLPLFADGFENGNLAAWTVRTAAGGTATAQSAEVRSGTYAARLSAAASGGSYSYARATIPGNPTDIMVGGDFNVTTPGTAGTNVPLFRLYDPAGTRLISFYRQSGSGDKLWVQHSGAFNATTASLSLGQWVHTELRVRTAGTGASLLEIRVDGALVYQTATASLGTTGVATVQIGNDTANQAFAAYADNIVVLQPLTGSDSTPPETALDSAPSGIATTATASFTFSASELGSRFECRMDAGAWVGCTSGKTYTGLSNWEHTFEVRAVDTAGNADPTPASRTWIVSVGTGCQTTAVPPTTPDPGTVVVADGFESGVLTKWTKATTQGDATVGIQNDDPHTGSCALRLHVTTDVWDSRANLTKTLPAGTNEVWEDGWFKFEREGADIGWNNPTFRLLTNGERVFDVSRQNGDGNFFVRYPNGSGGWTIPSMGRRLSTGRWYHIKAHVIAAGNLSTIQIWQDGTQIFDTNTATLGVSRLDVAMIGAEHQNQDGDVAADDIVIKAIVPPPSAEVFSDGFESNSFAGWTATKIGGDGTVSVQDSIVKTGSFAGELTATASSGSLSYVRKTLPANETDLTVKAAVRVNVEGGSGGVAPLLDLYGADGVRVVNVYRLNQNGNKIAVQHSGGTYSSVGTLPLATWAELKVRVVTNGTGTSTVQVWLNGTEIYTTVAASLGYNGVKQIQIGASGTSKGYTVLADDVTATKGTGGPDPDPTHKLLVADYLNKRLLITDFNGNVIWKFDNPTGRTEYTAGPIGVRWLPGNQILASFGSGEVGVVDVATKTWVWMTTGYSGEAFQSPYDAELLSDGNLAVALRFNSGGRVSVYNRSTGQEVWRHLLNDAHSVHYRSAAESYNSTEPTLLVGGFGAIREVTYRPGSSTLATTWEVTSEYTHDAIVLTDDELLTTEGYYIQKINRAGTKLWKRSTPDENRRMAVNPNLGGGFVYTVGEGDRVEFRDSNGNLLRDWAGLSDGTQLDYPYGIQVVDYNPT
jgi:hypothetical protein